MIQLGVGPRGSPVNEMRLDGSKVSLTSVLARGWRAQVPHRGTQGINQSTLLCRTGVPHKIPQIVHQILLHVTVTWLLGVPFFHSGH